MENKEKCLHKNIESNMCPNTCRDCGKVLQKEKCPNGCDESHLCVKCPNHKWKNFSIPLYTPTSPEVSKKKEECRCWEDKYVPMVSNKKDGTCIHGNKITRELEISEEKSFKDILIKYNCCYDENLELHLLRHMETIIARVRNQTLEEAAEILEKRACDPGDIVTGYIVGLSDAQSTIRSLIKK